MTREEAKDKMLTESVQYKNGLRTVALRKINNFIDKIFDYFENELQNAYKQGIKDEARCNQPKEQQ